VPGFERVCEKLTAPGEDPPLPKHLAIKTGCVAVCVRPDSSRDGRNQWREGFNQRTNSNGKSIRIPRPVRLVITCWGAREAIDRLRQIFVVFPRLDVDTEHLQRRAQLIPMQILETLCALSPDLRGSVRQQNDAQDTFSFLDRIPHGRRESGGGGRGMGAIARFPPPLPAVTNSERPANLEEHFGRLNLDESSNHEVERNGGIDENNSRIRGRPIIAEPPTELQRKIAQYIGKPINYQRR